MDSDQVSAIIAGVDFASIIVGIAAIAAAVVIVLIAVRGAKFLINGVKGETTSSNHISYNHLYEDDGSYGKAYYEKYKDNINH